MYSAKRRQPRPAAQKAANAYFSSSSAASSFLPSATADYGHTHYGTSNASKSKNSQSSSEPSSPHAFCDPFWSILLGDDDDPEVRSDETRDLPFLSKQQQRQQQAKKRRSSAMMQQQQQQKYQSPFRHNRASTKSRRNRTTDAVRASIRTALDDMWLAHPFAGANKRATYEDPRDRNHDGQSPSRDVEKAKDAESREDPDSVVRYFLGHEMSGDESDVTTPANMPAQPIAGRQHLPSWRRQQQQHTHQQQHQRGSSSSKARRQIASHRSHRQAQSRQPKDKPQPGLDWKQVVGAAIGDAVGLVGTTVEDLKAKMKAQDEVRFGDADMDNYKCNYEDSDGVEDLYDSLFDDDDDIREHARQPTATAALDHVAIASGKVTNAEKKTSKTTDRATTTAETISIGAEIASVSISASASATLNTVATPLPPRSILITKSGSLRPGLSTASTTSASSGRRVSFANVVRERQYEVERVDETEMDAAEILSVDLAAWWRESHGSILSGIEEYRPDGSDRPPGLEATGSKRTRKAHPKVHLDTPFLKITKQEQQQKQKEQTRKDQTQREQRNQEQAQQSTAHEDHKAPKDENRFDMARDESHNDRDEDDHKADTDIGRRQGALEETLWQGDDDVRRRTCTPPISLCGSVASTSASEYDRSNKAADPGLGELNMAGADQLLARVAIPDTVGGVPRSIDIKPSASASSHSFKRNIEHSNGESVQPHLEMQNEKNASGRDDKSHLDGDNNDSNSNEDAETLDAVVPNDTNASKAEPWHGVQGKRCTDNDIFEKAQSQSQESDVEERADEGQFISMTQVSAEALIQSRGIANVPIAMTRNKKSSTSREKDGDFLSSEHGSMRRDLVELTSAKEGEESGNKSQSKKKFQQDAKETQPEVPVVATTPPTDKLMGAFMPGAHLLNAGLASAFQPVQGLDANNPIVLLDTIIAEDQRDDRRAHVEAGRLPIVATPLPRRLAAEPKTIERSEEQATAVCGQQQRAVDAPVYGQAQRGVQSQPHALGFHPLKHHKAETKSRYSQGHIAIRSDASLLSTGSLSSVLAPATVLDENLTIDSTLVATDVAVATRSSHETAPSSKSNTMSLKAFDVPRVVMSRPATPKDAADGRLGKMGRVEGPSAARAPSSPQQAHCHDSADTEKIHFSGGVPFPHSTASVTKNTSTVREPGSGRIKREDTISASKAAVFGRTADSFTPTKERHALGLSNGARRCSAKPASAQPTSSNVPMQPMLQSLEARDDDTMALVSRDSSELSVQHADMAISGAKSDLGLDLVERSRFADIRKPHSSDEVERRHVSGAKLQQLRQLEYLEHCVQQLLASKSKSKNKSKPPASRQDKRDNKSGNNSSHARTSKLRDCRRGDSAERETKDALRRYHKRMAIEKACYSRPLHEEQAVGSVAVHAVNLVSAPAGLPALPASLKLEMAARVARRHNERAKCRIRRQKVGNMVARESE